jgi:hypothetical protein
VFDVSLVTENKLSTHIIEYPFKITVYWITLIEWACQTFDHLEDILQIAYRANIKKTKKANIGSSLLSSKID